MCQNAMHVCRSGLLPKLASHLSNRRTAAPTGLPSKSELLTSGFGNHNEITSTLVELRIAISDVGGLDEIGGICGGLDGIGGICAEDFPGIHFGDPPSLQNLTKLIL